MQYLYRAVNTPPEFMKAKRAWTIFRFKSPTEVKKIIKDAVEKDQAESLLIAHNRSPFKYVHSCSSEPTCKDYAGKRDYTYAFKYPKLRIFDLITKKYIASILKT
jgi:hypothetical protein